MSGIAGLLLAAGASTRMGRPKQLLPAGGRSLLDRVLGSVLDSSLDRIVLVLGHEAERIEKALETDPRHPRLRVVRNENYRLGMSTSMIAGLRQVEDAFDSVMILLADMPHITSRVIDRLIRRYLQSGLPLVALKTGTRTTPPVIINRKFYGEIHLLRGDVGARNILEMHPDQVCLVELEKGYEDADIDTPSDYRAFRMTLKEDD